MSEVRTTFWGALAKLERQERWAEDPDRHDRWVRHMDGYCREDCFCNELAPLRHISEASYRECLLDRARCRQPLPPRH